MCDNVSTQKNSRCDVSYTQVDHAYSFRINIPITETVQLTEIVLNVRNAFKNTGLTIDN